MKSRCVHSCKGLCGALEVAEHHEEAAIEEYRTYARDCDYPDVRELLLRLVEDRTRGLKLLREKRAVLEEKFRVIDNITDSYASESL